MARSGGGDRRDCRLGDWLKERFSYLLTKVPRVDLGCCIDPAFGETSMITCEEAKKIIQAHCGVLPSETIFLALASGFVAAEDVASPVSLPLFKNSAMDGFALDSSQTALSLRITGDIKAGDAPSKISQGETKRIMTGAPLPKGADTVLEKEKSVVHDGFLILQAPVSADRNVRHPGEEIKKGEPALSKLSVINPGTIGFLSGLGLERISVFKKPRVSVIATGSEL